MSQGWNIEKASGREKGRWPLWRVKIGIVREEVMGFEGYGVESGRGSVHQCEIWSSTHGRF